MKATNIVQISCCLILILVQSMRIILEDFNWDVLTIMILSIILMLKLYANSGKVKNE